MQGATRRVALSLPLILAAAATSAETLRIGTESDYAPYIFIDDKGLRDGFDVDLMDALCARGGFECIWIERPFPVLFEGLGEDLYEVVVGGLGDGPGRDAFALFSQYYLSDTSSVSSIVALDGTVDPASAPIAVAAGTLLEADLVARGYAVAPYPSLQEAVQAVLSGERAMVFATNNYLNSLPYSQAVLLQPVAEITVATGGPQIGVARDRADLLARIDAILAQMKADGTIEGIRAVWYPQDDDK